MSVLEKPRKPKSLTQRRIYTIATHISIYKQGHYFVYTLFCRHKNKFMIIKTDLPSLFYLENIQQKMWTNPTNHILCVILTGKYYLFVPVVAAIWHSFSQASLDLPFVFHACRVRALEVLCLFINVNWLPCKEHLFVGTWSNLCTQSFDQIVSGDLSWKLN